MLFILLETMVVLNYSLDLATTIIVKDNCVTEEIFL